MKNIIVREYLESLTEDRELDAIFPILLEVMDFKILTTPKETKGYQQYGKDVVAIGVDEADGKKKRFYFEIKGGEDKHITSATYNKQDGIRESIYEAKDRPFKDSSNPDFNTLPVKIVLVHNGTLKPDVRETFDGFIEREFPGNKRGVKSMPRRFLGWWKKNIPVESYEFERWDIYQLTELFTTKLFNEYLLTDQQAVQYFKKVLVLFNTPRNDNSDFKILIGRIFHHAGKYADLSKRKRLLLTETLKLISFIVHSYGRDANNLEPARACLNHLVLAYWKWILENQIEKDAQALKGFKNYLGSYRRLLDDYFERTLPVAKLKNGLWSPKGGRYEQAGYPMRALAYISTLVSYYNLINEVPTEGDPTITQQLDSLIQVIQNNAATHRPLLDNHSIPIILAIDFLIKYGRVADARTLLQNTWSSIILGYRSFKRLPDGRNRIKSVIQYMITNKKNIYYEDKTSHLFGVLLEYFAVLDMKDGYDQIVGFLKEINMDVAIFVPYNDEVLWGEDDITADNHELALFDHMLHEEGYQSEIDYNDTFEEFKTRTALKNEFNYTYRSVEAGMSFLLDLAHIYHQTPLFPNYWRSRISVPDKNDVLQVT